MALPFAWTTVNAGDKIVYDDTLTDLRGNADYLDDNAADVANDATVNATQNSSVDSSDDTTINATADSGYDAALNSGVDSGQNTGVNAAQDVGYDSTYYLGVDNPYYGTVYGALDIGYDAALYTVHYSSQVSSRDLTRYGTVNSTYYSPNYTSKR